MQGTITITSDLPTGKPGSDTDPWNPLARATKALLEDGTRYEAAAHVYLADSATGEISRWIGMVVEGKSGRLVFFPGLAAAPDRIRLQRMQHGAIDEPFNADHLTLEPDRRSWHATQGRRVGPQRRGGPRTWDLGDGNVLWFGMSIGSDSALRAVMQTTIATAPAPANRTEAVARLEEFGRAVGGAEMAVISKPPWPPPFPRAVCHFSLIVAPPAAPIYTGPERGFGGSLEGGLTAFDLPVGVPGQSPYTTANISSRVRLQVISTWFPGETTVPAVFYGRAG